jgi:hypothetical protein
MPELLWTVDKLRHAKVDSVNDRGSGEESGEVGNGIKKGNLPFGKNASRYIRLLTIRKSRQLLRNQRNFNGALREERECFDCRTFDGIDFGW